MTARFLLCLRSAALCLLAISLLLMSVVAQAADDAAGLINALGKASFEDAEMIVGKLAALGDPHVVPALGALADGELYMRKSDGLVFLLHKKDEALILVDPLKGTEIGPAKKSDIIKIKVNNILRRSVRTALGGLTLMSGDPKVRIEAVRSIIANPSSATPEVIGKALDSEKDPAIRNLMVQARAIVTLSSDAGADDKIKAVDTIAASGGRDGLTLLMTASQSADATLKPAIDRAIRHIESTLAFYDGAQNVIYGLSLGSVLLLAAIGLAITFGVMGIINMAHGEMVMIGAYSTFVVQELIRTHQPSLFDWSLAIALPLAFLVTGTLGFVIERLIIRHLYGRPLETLLATFGLSLVLQQAIRSIFGPTNREVGNPSWMSGSISLGELAITWNRVWIIVFAGAVFLALLVLLKRTPFGLKMRAVTQNRRMASSMGIRTPWVDALTFALGSGIAGMAGVALSQIDNVSPNLGQSYIIDSFMVVVFGGVGNLWGTLLGAVTLGVLNKVLEPFAGAVLGKILVLVLIILFIQKRPRGLFALKGRAVDA